MMDHTRSCTNALKLLKAMQSRDTDTGLLSDHALTKSTGMEYEEIKAAAEELVDEGFIILERHYTLL